TFWIAVAAQLLLAAVMPLHAQAQPQSWPTRSIRLIVSTWPGLCTDIMARMMSESLSRQLGQQVFVENVAGAAGMIGTQAAVGAAPGGDTFIFAPASSMSSNMYLYKSVPYVPLRDLAPVAMVCDSSPFAVSVNPDLPIKTIPDLVAYSKANAGKL